MKQKTAQQYLWFDAEVRTGQSALDPYLPDASGTEIQFALRSIEKRTHLGRKTFRIG